MQAQAGRAGAKEERADSLWIEQVEMDATGEI